MTIAIRGEAKDQGADNVLFTMIIDIGDQLDRHVLPGGASSCSYPRQFDGLPTPPGCGRQIHMHQHQPVRRRPTDDQHYLVSPREGRVGKKYGRN
ncbi:MAG: hypothetical protein ABSG53_33900 [Thermoguttaceae bacterium]